MISKPTLTFNGTGDAGQVPVYGCECSACSKAKSDARHRRGPSCVEINSPEGLFLIDAGLTTLTEKYPANTLSTILLTHYHMDHVAGLFHLRWGCNTSISVLGPEDSKGCDDLFKHPGILDFSETVSAFSSFQLCGITVTPIPLNHSKPCVGYLLEHGEYVTAYLTDTVGLPDDSEAFLNTKSINQLIIDCTHPPMEKRPRNHNDWHCVESIVDSLNPAKTWLTHISHQMDVWLQNNPLPEKIEVAYDGQTLFL